jgi:hypothetical protein
VDLNSYVGQTIRVKFLVHQDGSGALTGMFVDDVQLTLPCGSTRLRLRQELHTVRPRPLSWLENAKTGARERLVGSPVFDGLAIRKAWCSPIKCLRSTTTLRTLVASIQRARTVISPLHLRCPLQPPNPSCKGGYLDR